MTQNEGLGELPPPDGSADVPVGRAPGGGTEVVYVDAWSESLVRAYAAEQVAAERERCAQKLEAMADRSPDGDTDRDALLAAANELRKA